MDWRLPIEQQNPVSPAAHEPAVQPQDVSKPSFIDDDEYRRALRNPDLAEYAIQAQAYAERLRRDTRGL
jgi:hypothetical protein